MEQALKIIDSGELCSLKYVSFDKRRKTGGKLKSFEEARVTNIRKDWNDKIPSGSKKGTAPSHVASSTRNFYLCINGNITSAIRKVHIFLILELNGKKIML